MKSAQRQFLVTVGKYGLFATKSGGRIAADVTRVFDGGRLRPDLISSPAEAENVTVSRPYDPDRDAVILATLRQKVGTEEVTITVTPTDRNLIVRRGAPALTYPNALLVGLGDSDADAGSGDPATLELEFAIGEYT